MEWLNQFQIDHGMTLRSLLALAMVSSVCGVIGCFIVLRRMSFLADALAHSMLAGVVAGYLLMKLIFGVEASSAGMLLGALLAGLVTVATIGFVTKVSRIKQDTAIGIMYTGIFAVGGFFASYKPLSQHIQVDLYHFVVGSVLSVTDADMWMLVGVTIVVLSAIILFYRHLKLVSFDPVMAAALGIPVLALDYMLTACASLVVVSGVSIVGVVLVVALVITPAATAYLIHDRLHRMILTSVLCGIAGSWLGYGLASLCAVAPGPAIVMVNTGLFLSVLVLAPRYGLVADWWRRHQRVPQMVQEDILLFAYRRLPQIAAADQILQSVGGGHRQLRRALRLLEAQDFLEQDTVGVRLTAEGELEAQRLVRAHRLWESYLEQVGMPAEELHETAHRLEHVHDEATVDYLDDKLGHPLTDPHGTEIPENVQRLMSGDGVKLSLLREGYQVKVLEIAAGVPSTGSILCEEELVVGPRAHEGAVWTVIRAAGERVELDHDAADAIIVTVTGFQPPATESTTTPST